MSANSLFSVPAWKHVYLNPLQMIKNVVCIGVDTVSNIAAGKDHPFDDAVVATTVAHRSEYMGYKEDAAAYQADYRASRIEELRKANAALAEESKRRADELEKKLEALN